MSIQGAINQGIAVAGALYSQSAAGAAKKLEKEKQIQSAALEKESAQMAENAAKATSEYEKLAKEQGAKAKDIKAGVKAIQEQALRNQAQLLEKRAALGDVGGFKSVAEKAQKESEFSRKQEQAMKRAQKRQQSAINQKERTDLWIRAGQVGESEFKNIVEQARKEGRF